MSPADSATGWKPLLLYHCTIRSSPWLVKSFACLTSASVLSGFFENSWTQPALPQHSSLKPLASSRFSSIGVSFSARTAASSSFWKKNGMPNTLNASSICDSPAAISRLRLQLIDARPHHANRGRLVALRAAGVDGELHAAARLRVPFGAHVEQRLVPGGVDRRLRRQLDR